MSKLRANRALTRISIAAVCLTLVFAFSQQGVSRAGPEPAAAVPTSILPANVGVGIPTDAAIAIDFDAQMDFASVETSISVVPDIDLSFAWTADGRTLQVMPERRWMTDARYVLVVPGAAHRSDGSPMARPMRVSFTTQTAPTVTSFQLRYVALPDAPAARPSLAETQLKQRADVQPPSPSAATSAPANTAQDVSSRTSVTVGFSQEMDGDDVARNFAISPRVAGDFSWVGNNLTFTPSERLEPNARYAISLAGAHDRIGDPLGGDTSFSFTTTPGAQLVRVSPKSNETDVTSRQVELWFSRPMQTDATEKAFAVTDVSSGARVAGTVTWDDSQTQLRFRPTKAFTRGHTFSIVLASGAVDIDGNALAVETRFKTEAPPPPKPKPRSAARSTSSRPAPGPVAPSASLAGYALNQVNAARAAYGFGAIGLSGQVSAVSQAYANQMLATHHFSHDGLDGSTRQSRLRAGGVSFGYSGENICYHSGISVTATLNWCHAQFMSEPYPGVYNHIANILSPNYRRLGVGIATDGYRVYVVWDYVD